MRTIHIALVALAALCACAAADADTVVAEADFTSMSKAQLIKELTASKKAEATTQPTLLATQKDLKTATDRLAEIKQHRFERETARVVNERKEKHEEQKIRDKKKDARLKKKASLSELLMNHGAKFLSYKAAEAHADEGSIKQNAAVKAAALKGARAGAVHPLRKIARHLVVLAVKKARKDAKAKGIHNKHKIRQLTMAATKQVVTSMLKKQNAMVEKNVAKFLKLATTKFPPGAELAEHTDAPNNFSAPPMVHLSLDGGMEKLPEAPPATKKEATKKEATKKKSAGTSAGTSAAKGGKKAIQQKIADALKRLAAAKKSAAAAHAEALKVVVKKKLPIK